MKNNLTTTNQNAKLALSKSKSLLDLANKLLSKKDSGELTQSFPFIPFLREKGHSGWVNSVAITPDGERVVTGSWDETIKIWDMQSGECLDTLEGHSGWVNSVAITPGGERVVTGSSDNTIKIWDIQSGECLDTLEGHLSGVISVAITPDGERVVTGSWDGTIKIWDMQSGECIYTIDYNSKLSIDKDGYFRGELEGIKEYVRVSEAPLSQRKLTDEEIEHFRKKGDFLKVGKIVPKPYVEPVKIRVSDVPEIEIDEDEIPF